MAETSLCRECGVKLVVNGPQALCLDCRVRLAPTRAVSRLCAEFVAAGNGKCFELINIFLASEMVAGSCTQLAALLETTEEAIKIAIRRMRERYAELLREELVSDPANPPEFGIVSSSSAFQKTRWTWVLAAKQAPSAEADGALEYLCRIYWRPVYAYVRWRGYNAHDAEDLTQEFFFRFLAKDFLRSVDRSKGKFRSFILAAMENLLAKEWRRANTQKRGGRFTFISADVESAEQYHLQVPASGLSPEQHFEKQWAISLWNQVVERLREEFIADGKATQFESLKIFLTGEKPPETYARLAAKLDTTEAALKMAVRRMLNRYGELLRAEIGKTVSDPAEIEDELRALFAALRL
jgi:RNA polymerase sigma factor (sigma-70 family)